MSNSEKILKKPSLSFNEIDKNPLSEKNEGNSIEEVKEKENDIRNCKDKKENGNKNVEENKLSNSKGKKSSDLGA